MNAKLFNYYKMVCFIDTKLEVFEHKQAIILLLFIQCGKKDTRLEKIGY